MIASGSSSAVVESAVIVTVIEKRTLLSKTFPTLLNVFRIGTELDCKELMKRCTTYYTTNNCYFFVHYYN